MEKMLCDEAKGEKGGINARKRYRVSFANFILLATRSAKITLRETKRTIGREKYHVFLIFFLIFFEFSSMIESKGGGKLRPRHRYKSRNGTMIRRISHLSCMGDQVGPSLEQRVLKLPHGVVGIIISELINVHIIIKENAVTKGVERGWKCQLSPHR